MELIFGGAYQGKTQYAAEKYHCKDEEIFTCEGIELDRTARCIRHLERFAKACCKAGLDPREEFQRQAPGSVCLIADDISCGIRCRRLAVAVLHPIAATVAVLLLDNAILLVDQARSEMTGDVALVGDDLRILTASADLGRQADELNDLVRQFRM